MAKMIESRIHHDELQLLDSTKLEIDQSSTDKQTTLFQKGPFKSGFSLQKYVVKQKATTWEFKHHS